MWLSRNTEVLDSFPTQKWEVNACFIWSGYSVLEFTNNQPCKRENHKWRLHNRRQKSYGSHTIARAQHIARVICSTWHVAWCTYLFPKQTAKSPIMCISRTGPGNQTVIISEQSPARPLQPTEVVIWRCSVKKVFLKIKKKITGKHLCQSLFLIKLQNSGLNRQYWTFTQSKKVLN